ncbi:hypothetical protein EVAR_16032_1 [Eumeta japonica]|uniref:Uncharacterized protein n=1 Tax=Eumeta variegata TaxID=151549 RepID=A0A4C1VWA0_EUMVA|nr:hypothetical protein EVAR_16032_1 [Eumeta japonica]
MPTIHRQPSNPCGVGVKAAGVDQCGGDTISSKYVSRSEVPRKDRCRNRDVKERYGWKEDVVTRVERARLTFRSPRRVSRGPRSQAAMGAFPEYKLARPLRLRYARTQPAPMPFDTPDQTFEN